MMITVLMATYNGEDTLRQVLDGYCNIYTNGISWEIVVVNNGSTDRSQEILNEYISKLPLRVICENRRGKNVALNAALEHINGDYVFLTDDDAVPNERILDVYKNAVEANTGCKLFGGKVVARWPHEPDNNLLSGVPLGICFATNEALSESDVITYHDLYGPNIFVERNLLLDFRFSESIGPSAGAYAMGSETEFLKRVCESGENFKFVQEAIVEHIIDEKQLTENWILGRAEKIGRGQSRLNREHEAKTVLRVSGVPFYLFNQYFRTRLKILGKYLANKPLMDIKWKLHYLKGRILECYKMANNHESS